MFSVIIPLYNKEDTIIQTLNSVISQTYQNFELIVINDGSLDSSFKKVQNFIEETQYPITVINKKNEGVSVARNVGIDIAKNDWVCFLDADDQWTIDFLENMHNLIKKYPDAIMYCLQHKDKINNQKWKKNKSYYKDKFEGYVENFFKASLFGSIAGSSKICVARKSLIDIGGFPVGIKSGEDLYMWMELAFNGRVVLYNKVCTKRYTQVDNSRQGRDESIPYPLIFYSQRKEKKKLNIWVMLYLRRILLVHFIESIRNKQFDNARKRLSATKELFPFTVFFLNLIILLFNK